MTEIVEPVIGGMAAEGNPFRGFLYVGLMLTPEGPKVIEFNVRLGDPEAQVILPLIAEPLLPLLTAAAAGALRQTTCAISRGSPGRRGAGVARLSGFVGIGYADRRNRRRRTRGARRRAARRHRGENGQIVTAGGRVLTVVGRADSYRDAIARAYAGVARISFDGMQFRRDIGRKAL